MLMVTHLNDKGESTINFVKWFHIDL